MEEFNAQKENATAFKTDWIRASGRWPIDLSTDPLLRESFDLLRTKWDEVPCGRIERRKTTQLLSLPDDAFVAVWDEGFGEASEGLAFYTRGWYHELYKDAFRGKKLLDVGCGMGYDSVFYARNGALVTALDLAAPNIRALERLSRLKSIQNLKPWFMESLTSLDSLPLDFDFILCSGSMINTPLEVSRLECRALLEHLRVGGRWIELAYPETRWLREGALSPEKWGDRTDGGAPWMEWHDLDKLRYMWCPATFDVLLNFEFHDSDFNWFDLVRRS